MKALRCQEGPPKLLLNDEIKLDYSDVLIRPKRSTMGSRAEVDLKRTHKFLWSKKEWDRHSNYVGKYGCSWDASHA